MAKRLALVQADIWAKRNEAGDIYELDPCWRKRQYARGLLSARWLMSWPTKAIYLFATTKGLRCEVCNVAKPNGLKRVGVGVAKRFGSGGKRISGPRETKLEIFMNLTPVGGRDNMHAGLLSSTLVDELAHQGHFTCSPTTKVCDAKSAMCTEHTDNSNLGVVILAWPRPSAAAVISLFQNKKRAFSMQTNSRHVLHFFALSGHSVYTQSTSACLSCA